MGIEWKVHESEPLCLWQYPADTMDVSHSTGIRVWLVTTDISWNAWRKWHGGLLLETQKARISFRSKHCRVKISSITFVTVSTEHLSTSGLEIYQHIYIFYTYTVNPEFLGHVEPPGHAQNKPHCTSADGLMHMQLVCSILKNSRCRFLVGRLWPTRAWKNTLSLQNPCVENLCPK